VSSVASRNHNSRGRTALISACLFAILPGTALSQVPGDDPNGLVYFAGTVRTIIQGAAIIDLGDVHTLKTGDRVAVFRSQDSYMRPLGVITVKESHPNWFHTARNSSSHLQRQDLVVYVRTVAEIGRPQNHFDDYLAEQYLKSRGRNAYSTVNDRDVAMAIREVTERQPVWVREQKRVSGLVAGTSLDEAAENRLELLTHQINQIRRLGELGVPAAEAAGPAWQQVMSVLRGPTIEVQVIEKLGNDQQNFNVVDAPEDVEVPVDRIRNTVKRILFARPEEVQDVVSMLVTSMLRMQVGDERLWLRRQLLEGQFPSLADDDQIYFDVDLITRQLRSTD